MTTTTTTSTTTRTRWGRFLDTVLPAPSPDRLVRVAEIGRTSVPLAEGSLADIQVSAVIQESRTMNGDSRFVVLVAARDAKMASEVLTGM